MANIGLSIIVKNEAHVIERCLDSVKSLCDYFIIVDTGSTDGTQDIVLSYLSRHGLSGHVCDVPWKNFAYNRTTALEEMRKITHIDYCLMIDADEQIKYAPNFDAKAFKSSLRSDIINIETILGSISYYRPQLFRNDVNFFWKGALHEFLEAPMPSPTRSKAEGLVNHPSPDGARSRNANKYIDDARLLARELETETDPLLRTRYQFYLAQSLRDAGETKSSISAYNARATMGGWQEEVFISYYNIGRLGERLNYPDDEIICAYLRAHEASPNRAESLVAAARFCRNRNRHTLAFLFASRALELTPPDHALFLEPDVYTHRAKDEAAVAAYWVGEYHKCLAWCDELLAGDGLPATDRERITQNRAFAVEKLA